MSSRYAIVVKNDNLYDVIGFWTHPDIHILDAVDIALNSSFPIISVNASSHKLTATYGSIYNGTEFSGGNKIIVTEEPTEEQLNSFDLYVFLCNNVVIARVAALDSSYKKEMFAAAHSSGMTLIKVPSNQILEIGTTYILDKNSFSEI